MFQDKRWIKMPKWTIFQISFLWKHQCLSFHHWDYLTKIWWSIIDIVEKPQLIPNPTNLCYSLSYPTVVKCTKLWLNSSSFSFWYLMFHLLREAFTDTKETEEWSSILSTWSRSQTTFGQEITCHSWLYP